MSPLCACGFVPFCQCYAVTRGMVTPSEEATSTSYLLVLFVFIYMFVSVRLGSLDQQIVAEFSLEFLIVMSELLLSFRLYLSSSCNFF